MNIEYIVIFVIKYVSKDIIKKLWKSGTHINNIHKNKTFQINPSN